MEDLSGRQLRPYHIVALLGEGGMAAVYKAYHPTMDRFVALKILAKHAAGDPQFAARFQQEARVLAHLQHPHILPVYDFGEADGYAYLAMPFIESGTLVSLMKSRPLPLSQVRRIVTQIGDALDYAHSHGLIHRDVKPSNVLLDARGNCLLTDFGIAKIMQSSLRLTPTDGLIGTPAYMSPEQGLGDVLDLRSDVYSLGIILYELTTGRPPYEAETPMAVVIKHIHDPLPAPGALNPELPPSLEQVILKALAKKREDRFASAGEFVQALKAAIPETWPGSRGQVILPARVNPQRRTVMGVVAAYITATPSVIVQLGRRMAFVTLGVVAVLIGLMVFLSQASVIPSAALALVPSPTPTMVIPKLAPIQPARVASPTPAASATPAATPTPGIGSTEVSAMDGMVLHYVPAGEFLRGSLDTDQKALAYEMPQRSITLDAFWIDETEVTNAMYARCAQAGICRALVSAQSATHFNYYGDAQFQDHPVVYVNWEDARTYCAWAGRRLPTEAEWEKAARGVDGQLYPWGDTDPGPTRTNFRSLKGDTTQVGAYPENASPYGAVDMAGNVWEWVGDWYKGSYYRDADSPLINPQGPSATKTRGLRGGAWNSDLAAIRTAYRFQYGPTSRSDSIGFRCAR